MRDIIPRLVLPPLTHTIDYFIIDLFLFCEMKMARYYILLQIDKSLLVSNQTLASAYMVLVLDYQITDEKILLEMPSISPIQFVRMVSSQIFMMMLLLMLSGSGRHPSTAQLEHISFCRYSKGQKKKEFNCSPQDKDIISFKF